MHGTASLRYGYRHIIKPILFRLDPEDVHDRMCAFGEWLGMHALTRWLSSTVFHYAHPTLTQTILGMSFANPVGLAAGFDKDARLLDILPTVGFGFEEIGSVTGEPCAGNARPRLWRLPTSRGLLVYYGLKNDGCEAIASRLREKTFAFPVGISVAKTNSPSTVQIRDGIADYVKAFRAFEGIGDYATINISCPNAFGGEPFTNPSSLDLLLTEIDAIPTTKPIFLKVPADSTTEQLDALVAVADTHRVHGFVIANLTKTYTRPEIQPDEIQHATCGGVSGKATFACSNALIAHLYRTAGTRYVIIGCGGIFSAEDAYEKIRQGASLVQLITGMIFEGPQLIGEINRGLVRLLARDGFSSIRDAIGSAHRTPSGASSATSVFTQS